MSSSPICTAAPSVASVLARFDRSSPDRLLHSLAEEILRLWREQADLSARLRAVEQLQAVADRLLPPALSDELEAPKAVTIDATHMLSDGSGFYPLEFDAQGNPYRWTGPSPQFSLSFFVERRFGGKFRLAFSRFAAQVSGSFLRCQLDGRTAEFTLHEQAGGFEISGTLPPRADAGATLLTFTCPAVAAGAGGRLLGLCFQKLTVRAAAAPEQTEPLPAKLPSDAQIIPHPGRRVKARE